MVNSAAASQLERMGVELKCPICLSLFNQAASLTCNHCFCTSCILQSMKRASCCPICKVPATRREVRVAPQMDSLVTIFKGMQTSAGLNLFQTQPSEPMPFAREEKQACQDVSGPGPQFKGRKKRAKVSSIATDLENMSLNYPKTRRRRQPESVLSNVTNQDPDYASGDAVMKSNHHTASVGELPSIDSDALPENRVQDPLPYHTEVDVRIGGEDPAVSNGIYGMSHNSHAPKSRLGKDPTSEGASDIVQNQDSAKAGLAAKVVCSQVERGEDNSRTCVSADPHSLMQRCSPTEPPYLQSFREQPQLAPFFWLRDDVLPSQEERLTGLTQTQLTARALPLRPSFSDLKDSDDEQSDDAQNENEVPCYELGGNIFSAPDSCDSDTFQWTQRPCSPELSSSPVKDTKRVNFQEEKEVSKEQEVLDNESKSPIKIFEDPVAVQATQTPQLLQEPARTVRGTLAKSSRSEKSRGVKSSIKACRSLRSNDPSSITNSSTRHIILPVKGAVPKVNDTENLTSFRLETPAGTNEASECVDLVTEQTIATVEEENNYNQDDLGGLEPVEENKPGKTASGGEARRKSNKKGPACVFCGSSGDSKVAGKMTTYEDTFSSQGSTTTRTVHVHKLCAEWAPDVYFEEGEPRNLACEVTRGQKIKCSKCGKRGAALGCCNNRCKRSFHYPCARVTPGCKWDKNDFVMFCPQHVDCNFPKRKMIKRILSNYHASSQEDTAGLRPKNSTQLVSSTGRQTQRWPPGPACKWVLCGSGLSSEMKGQMALFTALTGASLQKRWSPSVTHVITGTEEQGAARRTLKFLMAILESKWIVRFDWLLECMRVGHALAEEHYEVNADINGFVDGPKRSRALAAEKAPRLFEGSSFYLCGDFTSITKQDLQCLIVAGRGVVLHRKPLRLEHLPKTQGQFKVPQRGQTIVIYDGDDGNLGQMEPKNKLLQEAMSVARPAGAQVVPHTWLLDSVAACMLQPVA